MTDTKYKISIIGAGNVGATTAFSLLTSGYGKKADIFLFDIDEGIAKGKALDLMQAAAVNSTNAKISGTSDYNQLKMSDIVVITAGTARKPGMSRQELININAEVLKEISLKLRELCPDSIIIVVTNPLDIMTYLVYKTTKFDARKVIGMAGVLDSARLEYYMHDMFGAEISDTDALVIGAHNETNMLPLFDKSYVRESSLTETGSSKQLEILANKTRTAGKEIVDHLKTGSAFYAPSLAVLKIISAIVNDEKLLISASCYLQGEYGVSDVCLGVPCTIGKNGIDKIIDLDLHDHEDQFIKSTAKNLKETITKLNLDPDYESSKL